MHQGKTISIIDTLNKAFGLKLQQKTSVLGKGRPCLNKDIGSVRHGVQVNFQELYNEAIANIKMTWGKLRLSRYFRGKMLAEAEALDFELPQN